MGHSSITVVLKRDIWLIETLLHRGPMTRAEINDAWTDTRMSEGEEFSKPTFYNMTASIREMFGLKIVCKNRKHFICNPSDLYERRVQHFMLDAIAAAELYKDCQELHRRILLEDAPSENGRMQPIVMAMKGDFKMGITYGRYEHEAKEHTIEPYCIKYYHRRWYMLGKCETGELRMYAFDRIQHIDILREKFKMDEDFDADEFFADMFGVLYGVEQKSELVEIAVTPNEACYLRDVPMHQSQRDAGTKNGWIHFYYHLRPTADFIGYIVSREDRMKVVRPKWLKRKIRSILKSTLKMYE